MARDRALPGLDGVSGLLLSWLRFRERIRIARDTDAKKPLTKMGPPEKPQGQGLTQPFCQVPELISSTLDLA